MLETTFKLRLTPDQRSRLDEKANSAGITSAMLIRYWIDDRPVMERQAVSDRETVTELRKIGGMIKRSFNVLDKLDMGSRSTLNREVMIEARETYKALIETLKRIPG